MTLILPTVRIAELNWIGVNILTKQELVDKLKQELSPEARKALSEYGKERLEYLHTPEGQKELVEPVANVMVRFSEVLSKVRNGGEVG